MVPRKLRKFVSESILAPGLRLEGRRPPEVLEYLPEMVALIDANGIVLYINSQTERVLGYSRSEVEGRNIFEFIHPEDAPRAGFEYSDTLQHEGERIPSALRLRDRSGSWIPTEIIANNQLRNPDIQAVIFAARDLRFHHDIQDAIHDLNQDFELAVEKRVTELARINAELRIENQARRRAEWELQHTISLLNATLDSTTDGLLVVSLDGFITSCNKQFMEMWGLGSNCAVGRKDEVVLGEVVHLLVQPEEFVKKVHNLYADRTASSFDVLHLKDGRILERYSQPQRVDDSIVGRVWSFRDVTRARNLEIELRQAQKMEALGRLAGGIAHDFNNLLMLITGFANQLLDKPAPADARNTCEQILTTTRRAAAVTRQLLAFSRKLPESPIVADLNVVVLDLERMLRRLLSDQIQLKISVGSEPLPVLADVSQLEVMLLNLAINAQDAMPAGGMLTMKVLPESQTSGGSGKHDSGPFALLEVSDTGHGMSDDIKSHIFEPFFTTKEVGKGTGLGLSTVFGIVERTGGRIEVRSEPNNGATFRVHLPLAVGAPSVVSIRPPALPAGGGSETIILAEDEDGIRAMTRSYLEGRGYRVLEAADGREAVRIAQEYDGVIQLIVTDILMPALRGDTAVTEIRKTRPEIKAIFVSGYTDQDVRLESEDILYKPFDFPELGRRIRSALETK